MSALIPFNRKNSIALSTGFGEFTNMLDDFFADGWPFRRSLVGDTFKVDLQENDKEYIVEAELPGIKKDDVNLDYNEERLRISINKSEEEEEKNKNYIHRERRYASMTRSIYLRNTKPDGITAKLEDGILRITVPKQDNPVNSKQILIE
jgi:HSP20 family protein